VGVPEFFPSYRLPPRLFFSLPEKFQFLVLFPQGLSLNQLAIARSCVYVYDSAFTPGGTRI